MADPSVPSVLSHDTSPLSPSIGERFKPSGWVEEGDEDPYGPAIAAHKEEAKKRKALAKGFEERRAGEEAETERAYAGLEKAMAQPRPAPYRAERVESPPKPEDYRKMSMEYLGAMVLLGAFGGKFIRSAANAPLAAFNGALNGWQEGNLEAYKEKSAEWKEKQQQVLDNNRARLDEYRTILEDRNASIQEQMDRVKLVAAKHQDKLWYDRASADNYTGVGQALDQSVAIQEKAQAATDKLVDRYTKTNETAVERANQWKAHLATPEGQQHLAQLDQRSPGAAFEMRAFVDQWADKDAPAQLPAPDSFGPSVATEPPPGTPMPDAAATARMPPDLRGPMPLNMKPADMAARQFRIESYNQGKGEPGSADWAAFNLRQHPARSAVGMAMQEFYENYESEHGRPPPPEEVSRAAAHFAAQVAAGRTIGNRAGGIEVSVQEFNRMLPLASRASSEVPRGQWRPINKLQNDLKLLRSNPAYGRLVVANRSAITAYANTMSRSGANTVYAQSHASELLDLATSDADYQSRLRQLKLETDEVEKAPMDAMKVIDRLGLRGPEEESGGGARGEIRYFNGKPYRRGPNNEPIPVEE